MISKVKKAIITATVFLVVGISGSIISGIYMIPRLASEIYNIQREINNVQPIETEVFSTEQLVDSLDIKALEYNDFDVELKPSMDNKTRIKVYEYSEGSINVTTKYNASEKKLEVIGVRENPYIFEAGSLREFLNNGYNTVINTLKEGYNIKSKIIIEIPNKVDITFLGDNYKNMIIEDNSVLKDNLYFSSNEGYINLPINNTLKNIDIRTNSHLNMDFREFINAESVNISAHDLSIESNGYEIDYKNINSIPKNVNIQSDYVEVTTYIPIGLNVMISGNNVEYSSNFNDNPLNVQLISKDERGSSYYTVGEEDRFNNKKLGSNFKGILGGGDEANNNLTIKGYYDCELENLNSIELESNLR